MDYLKSEHLKFKRTISNKLIFIVPLITAIFAWLMGGYIGYQYMTLYWWYAFLLPGAIAILCSLSHRKEENAGKYYSVFSMPVNLSRFEFAKGIILVEKLLVSAIFLALLISMYDRTIRYRSYSLASLLPACSRIFSSSHFTSEKSIFCPHSLQYFG